MTRAEKLTQWLPLLASSEQQAINNSVETMMVLIPCGSPYYQSRGFTSGEFIELANKVKTTKEIESIYNALMDNEHTEVLVGVRPKRKIPKGGK